MRAAVLLAAADPTAVAPAAAWWPYALAAALVLVAGVALLVVAVRRGGKSADATCANCGKVMMSEWPRCMFCQTPRGFRKAQLHFVSGPLNGRIVDLDAAVTTIGSAPGTSVQLEGQGVSRKHAGIRKADGGYELADLGSTNGVYVNGEKVAKRLAPQPTREGNN